MKESSEYVDVERKEFWDWTNNLPVHQFDVCGEKIVSVKDQINDQIEVESIIHFEQLHPIN